MNPHERPVGRGLPRPGTGLAGGQRPAPRPGRHGGRCPRPGHDCRPAGVPGQAVRRRVRRHHLAGRVRRPGPDQRRADRVQPGGAQLRAAGRRVRHRAGHAGPDHPGAAAPRSRRSATCRRCCAARRSGASCSPSPARAPTWPACRPARSATATSWVLNGQKVWTSGAQYSDLRRRARPDRPDACPSTTASRMFIVDMHAPGVTVRPLRGGDRARRRSTRSSSTTSGCPPTRSSARSTTAGPRPS